MYGISAHGNYNKLPQTKIIFICGFFQCIISIAASIMPPMLLNTPSVFL